MLGKLILSREYLQGVKWSFVGQILTRLVNLCSTIVLARLMLPVVYGKYVYLIGTLIFLSQLFSLSIRTTCIRNIAYFRDNKSKIEKYLYTTLTLSLIFGCVGSIFLLIIALIYPNNIVISEYGYGLVLPCLVTILFEIIYVTVLGILEGFPLFKQLNLTTIVVASLKVFLAVSGVYFFGLNGSIYGWVIGSFFGLICSVFLLINLFKTHTFNLKNLSLSLCRDEVKLFLQFSIPMSIQMVTILASVWIIKTKILSNQDIGKEELALYNIAEQWKGFMIYLPAILINLTQSFISKYLSIGEHNKINLLVKKTQQASILMTIIIGTVFYFFAGHIVILFGDAYANAEYLIILMIIPALFTNLASLTRELLFSQGRVWEISVTNLIVAILILVLFGIFTNHYPPSTSFVLSVGLGDLMMYLMFLFIIKSDFYFSETKI